MFGKKEKKEDDSDSDGGDDNWVPPVIAAKPTAPVARAKAPPKPEEIKEYKMEIVIHKIGGREELPLAEMDKLWDFGNDPVPPKMINLINDKLRQTASLGNVNALRFLLQKKGDINSQCPHTGNTPLMQAVGVSAHLNRQKSVVTFLIDAGADCTIRNRMNMSPKSPTPGLPDNPLVVLVRELDLKRKDTLPRASLPEPVVYGMDEDQEQAMQGDVRRSFC